VPSPENPRELELARKAVTLFDVTGCCKWDERAARRLLAQGIIGGLTPDGVMQLLVEFVQSGGNIVQVKEQRSEWRGFHEFYYKAIIPVDGLRKGLFVEFRLVDDDNDLPIVELCNCHEQN
jgi:hypothetical protein